MLRKFNFQRVGRNFFDPKNMKTFPQHSIQVWPGLYIALQKNDHGVMVQVDSTNKVIRNESVLSVLKEMSNPREQWKEQFENSIVVTSYNQCTYRVNSIDFDKTVSDSFEITDKKTKETT